MIVSVFNRGFVIIVVLSGKRYGHHTASPYGVSIYEIARSNLLSIYDRSYLAAIKTNRRCKTEKLSKVP
jgi:hypothetical protein